MEVTVYRINGFYTFICYSNLVGFNRLFFLSDF